MKLRVEFDDGTDTEVDISDHLTTLRQEEHVHRILGDDRYNEYVKGMRYPDIVRALVVVHLADEFPDVDPGSFDASMIGPGDSGKADSTS